MEPEFSRVYAVTIKTYYLAQNPEEATRVENSRISVLADDIEDAMERGKDYAGCLKAEEEWSFYEITEITETCSEVFIGLEDDTEEVTLPLTTYPRMGIDFPSSITFTNTYSSIPQTGILWSIPGATKEPDKDE